MRLLLIILLLSSNSVHSAPITFFNDIIAAVSLTMEDPTDIDSSGTPITFSNDLFISSEIPFSDSVELSSNNLGNRSEVSVEQTASEFRFSIDTTQTIVNNINPPGNEFETSDLGFSAFFAVRFTPEVDSILTLNGINEIDFPSSENISSSLFVTQSSLISLTDLTNDISLTDDLTNDIGFVSPPILGPNRIILDEQSLFPFSENIDDTLISTVDDFSFSLAADISYLFVIVTQSQAQIFNESELVDAVGDINITLTSSINFSVRPVPVPGAIYLLGSALSILMYRRNRS